MATYRLVRNGVVLDDKKFVPDDPRNGDWREYQRWLAAGNAPIPAPTPEDVAAAKETEERRAAFTGREWRTLMVRLSQISGNTPAQELAALKSIFAGLQ
jgi:hypothetical protein